ncbi:MAG TPA: ATP-binding protein [Baekduia sp.]|nr:ATP-binding protein [Baekduia sp.]
MSVHRRLTVASVLVALAAVLVLGVPLAVVEAARVRGDETARLEREADGVAAVVDDRVEQGLPVTATQLARLVRPGHRVTVTARGRAVTAGARLEDGVVSARAASARLSKVVVAAPRSEIGARVARSWVLIGALSLGGVVLAFALAASVARRLSRPLEAVAEGSARLGEGDFSVRVPPSGVREIDAIATALGRSAERIARLVGREREFSSNVSHQLRTPLTALRLRLEEGLHDAEEDGGTAVRAELEAAVREADRLEATVADLLAYARAESAGRRVAVSLDTVAAEHVRVWQPVVRRAGRTLTLRTQHPVAVGASRGTVGQALDVLLENALRHGAGPIVVEVTAEPGWAAVAVQDAGAGVPEDAAATIFARGATRAEGTGIGLHLARALAVADGGTLRLARRSPPRFELRLRVFAGS